MISDKVQKWDGYHEYNVSGRCEEEVENSTIRLCLLGGSNENVSEGTYPR